VSEPRSAGTKAGLMEGQILALLAEGALAPEQIAANLGANDDAVRRELEALRERGLVERSAIVQYAEAGSALAY
jgi:predicted ArsR family transcriptional regulator